MRIDVQLDRLWVSVSIVQGQGLIGRREPASVIYTEFVGGIDAPGNGISKKGDLSQVIMPDRHVMGRDDRVILENPFKRIGTGSFIGRKIIGIYGITAPDGIVIPTAIMYIADRRSREEGSIDRRPLAH